MNMHVNRPDLAVDSIPVQLAAQERRAEKTRQRVSKLREKASAEIERLIAFLDASDGYTMDEREESVDDIPCDDSELEISEGDDEPTGDENEPSLGSICASENRSQQDWALGSNNDLEDEHDGAEPDDDAEDDKADYEPSLGWTADGSFVADDDREAGVGPRWPQNRTNLNTTLAVECSYRKFVHGLTDRQKDAVCPRITDSDVVVR